MAGTRPAASALTMTTATPSKRRAIITTPTNTVPVRTKSARDRGVWSEDEHDKFLVAIKLYPKGPWKAIAEQVGTRSARQVQTHAQKYYEKVARRMRGLRKDRKKLVRPEHRLDDDMMKLCKVTTFDVASASIGPIGRGFLAHQLPVRTNVNSTTATTHYSRRLQSVHTLEPPSSVVSSPMGIDSVDPSTADVDRQPFVLKPSTSFLSMLIDSEDNDGDDCRSMSGSSQSADDVADLAEVDALVDLDDHYLDFLMDVLETDDQSTYTIVHDDDVGLCFDLLY